MSPPFPHIPAGTGPVSLTCGFGVGGDLGFLTVLNVTDTMTIKESAARDIL
jgi:hypothetical protein